MSLVLSRRAECTSRAFRGTLSTVPYFFLLLAFFSAAFVTSAQDGFGNGSGSVIVYVVGRDGQSVDRTFDVMLSRIGFGYKNVYQKTGTNGVTEFTGLAFSRYRVVASDPLYSDAGAEFEITGARSMLTVTLVVDLKDESDAPAKGFTLAPKAKKEVLAAIKAMRAGNYDEALEHLQTVYKMAPGNPDVNDMLGEVYLAKSDLANAQTYIQQAVSIEPDNISALTDMGELKIQQRDYVLAEISLKRAVELSPQTWRTHWLLGIVLFRLNQVEKARDEANRAIKLGKGQAFDAQYLLGESLAVLGRHEEAIKALQTFLSGAPNNSNAPAAKTLIARLQAADEASPSSTSPPKPADDPSTLGGPAQPN